MQPSQFDELEEDTEVEILEVTKENDDGQWLAAFNEGIGAGRKDVLGALGRVLGKGPFADDLMLKVIAELEPKV